MFEPYLKAHVVRFAHKSITTDDFKGFLYEYFSDQKSLLEGVDWMGWFVGEGTLMGSSSLHLPHHLGMPVVHNEFDNSAAVSCTQLAAAWAKHRECPKHLADTKVCRWWMIID